MWDVGVRVAMGITLALCQLVAAAGILTVSNACMLVCVCVCVCVCVFACRISWYSATFVKRILDFVGVASIQFSKSAFFKVAQEFLYAANFHQYY